jgi:short-subunit dehydrogenase
VKNVLIIGATSAIAEASARIWAQKGYQLFLVGRNQEQLNLICQDLLIRGSPKVINFCVDLNNLDAHHLVLDNAFQEFGTIDIVLIAHGTLSNQADCERSVDLTLEEIKTNALSSISLLTLLGNRFEQQRFGVIAIISSVAGDRGRQSNYVYGSAKGMLNIFTSGLRQRLYKSGVSVLTVKPGFVDTPMTANFKKGFLWSSPNLIAKLIVAGSEKANTEIYAPKYWWLIMFVIKIIPTNIFIKFKL